MTQFGKSMFRLQDAIKRADERCKQDDDGFVVLEDMISGEWIVQTFVAVRPPCTRKVYEIWPQENE